MESEEEIMIVELLLELLLEVWATGLAKWRPPNCTYTVHSARAVQ